MVLKQHTRPGSNLKESALVPPNNEGAEDSHTLKSIFFLGWPSSEGMSEPKTCKEPCYVSAGLEIPQKSPLFIKAVKDDEFISTMNWSQFNSKFENLAIGAPLAIKERFSIDTWTDILDYVESPNDLYSLALTSRTLYNLALPHLYKSISIRSPLFVHEVTTGEKLIPIDHLLEPISPPPVYRYVSNKVGARPPFEKRRRIELPGAHHDHCGQPSTITMYKKPHLLRYVRELRIEKWEAQRVVIASDSPPQFGKEFNLYEAGEFGPEGVKDLMWRPEGCLSYHSLSGTLVDLLKSMPMLEKFSYNPQRYNTFYYESDKTILQKKVSCHLLNLNPAQGMTELLLNTLKTMPNLSSLTINFQDWDPFDPGNYGPSSAIESNSKYEPHLHGLVGFKNLEELVVLGIMVGERFAELERVVKDHLLSSKPGRRLKRIEIRAHTDWWEFVQIERESSAAVAHEILSWVSFMWDTCFPPSKRFRRRVRRLGLVGINTIFEFGPTKWQFNYDKTSTYSCLQNITALDLQGLSTTYTIEIIDILAKRFRLRQPQHLKVFAVECRICYLNTFLDHHRGLRELYVLDPDKSDSSTPDMIDIQGIHRVFDTIFKRHLLTLEILVVEEIICTPKAGGTSEVINPIEGWRDRGGKLRELAINIWGPWEEISQFLSAFQNLKALRLFSRRLNKRTPKRSFLWPIFESTFGAHYGHLYDAQVTATAVMIANTWGRDVISGKGDMGLLIPEGHRWIWVGDCIRPWKWHTHDAGKYAGWMNFESQLWFKYFDRDSSRANWRAWEEEVKMLKVLRQSGILIHSSEEFEAKWEGCCDGCSVQLDDAEENSGRYERRAMRNL